MLFSKGGLFGSKPVIGRVTESSLRLRKRIAYRNSFQRFLTATMRPESGGTVITGKVAMHPFVRVFMTVWFGGVILIGGALFVSSIGSVLSSSGSQAHNAWLGLIILPAMIVFGYALVRLGGYLARDETGFLTDFLIRTLDAREQSNAVQP